MINPLRDCDCLYCVKLVLNINYPNNLVEIFIFILPLNQFLKDFALKRVKNK